MPQKGKMDRREFIKTMGAVGAVTVMSGACSESSADLIDTLIGKVAVVTGGGRGIGRGIVMALANEGADIAIIETNKLDSPYNQYGDNYIGGYPYAEEVANEVRALGRGAIAVNADVSHKHEVQAAVDQILNELNRIDIWVNNAGVINSGPTLDIEDEAWDLLYNVNVKAHLYTAQAVIPHMREIGGGKIINIASTSGHHNGGMETFAAYGSSKHAAIGFAMSLAKEVGKYNITVNVLCPGDTVPTQMTMNFRGTPGNVSLAEDMSSEEKEAFYKIYSSGMLERGMRPEDHGAYAVYLAKADNVTGQSFHVCGKVHN